MYSVTSDSESEYEEPGLPQKNALFISNYQTYNYLSTTSSINGSYSKVKSVLLKIPKTYSFIMQLKIKPIIIQLKVYSRKKLSLTSFINEIRNSSFTMPNSKRKHPSDESQLNISPLKQTTFLATCHAFCFGTSCTNPRP